MSSHCYLTFLQNINVWGDKKCVTCAIHTSEHKDLSIPVVSDIHKAVLVDGYAVRVLQLSLLPIPAELGDQLAVRPEHADALLVGVRHVQRPLIVAEAQGTGAEERQGRHKGVVRLEYLYPPGDAGPADVEEVVVGGGG